MLASRTLRAKEHSRIQLDNIKRENIDLTIVRTHMRVLSLIASLKVQTGLIPQLFKELCNIGVVLWCRVNDNAQGLLIEDVNPIE